MYCTRVARRHPPLWSLVRGLQVTRAGARGVFCGRELAGRAGYFLAPIVEGAAAAASKSVKELFQ